MCLPRQDALIDLIQLIGALIIIIKTTIDLWIIFTRRKEPSQEMAKEVNTKKVVKELGFFRLMVIGVLLSTLLSMVLNSYNRIRSNFFKEKTDK